MSDLIISNVQGWAPVTRLYANVAAPGDHWLISVINVGVVRDAVADSLGIDLPPMPDLAETGHVEIYRATLDRIPRWEWVPDGDVPAGDPPDGYTEHLIDEDHGAVKTPDGEVWARYQRVQYGEDFVIAAVDANADPLDGLTPAYVLPHGTSFEQALEHIRAQEAGS